MNIRIGLLVTALVSLIPLSAYADPTYALRPTAPIGGAAGPQRKAPETKPATPHDDASSQKNSQQAHRAPTATPHPSETRRIEIRMRRVPTYHPPIHHR